MNDFYFDHMTGENREQFIFKNLRVENYLLIKVSSI